MWTIIQKMRTITINKTIYTAEELEQRYTAYDNVLYARLFKTGIYIYRNVDAILQIEHNQTSRLPV